MLNIIRHQRNAIQDHNKIPLHNLAIIKKIITTGENMEKSEHTYTADGNVKWHNHFGKQFNNSSNKHSHHITQKCHS